MDLLKNSLSVLPLEENESLANSDAGLIKAFNNLDLNGTQHLLHPDQKSKEKIKLQPLLPLNCTQDSSKECVANNGCKSVDVKSKSSVGTKEKNNVAELIEIPKTSRPVIADEGESVVSSKESSGKMICIKSEEDLSEFFSELCLDKKLSCNALSSVTGTLGHEDSQDKPTCKNILAEEVHGPSIPCANGTQLKKGENANNSSPNKHTSENSLDEKVRELTIADINDAFVKKEEKAVSFHKKLPGCSDCLIYSPDVVDEEDLVERGSTKKSADGEQKAKKIISGRTQKAAENTSNYLKSFPKLHMSGGLIVDAPPNRTLNATSGYLNLVPFNDSSGQSVNFMAPNVQASLPTFFDPNPINPVIQSSHTDNSCLFSMSQESDSLLDDVFSLPSAFSSGNNSGTSFMETQSQNTVVLQDQKNVGSCQSGSTYDCLEDILNYPSPVSETSSYPGPSSRSTSPESGYCSSPYSDDSSEQYKSKQPSNSCTSLLDICSPPPPVPSENEFVDNWDWSIFDFESTSHGVQPPEEEIRERINVIKQDLKKCEELCKPNGSNVVNNKRDTVSPSFTTPDSPNSVNSCFSVSSPPPQRCSTQTLLPNQQQPCHVNIAPSAQVNAPQVLVIYVPYAANATDKSSKPFKPIEPHPEGQRLLARSPRECLKEKLDRKKQMCYLYKLTEKLQNGDKDVIYIENVETRQTNLHLAVIKQDLELAYCLLELHKKCSGDISMVNCRDVYRKTALQYAVRNVMTLFVEYLKAYGAK